MDRGYCHFCFFLLSCSKKGGISAMVTMAPDSSSFPQTTAIVCYVWVWVCVFVCACTYFSVYTSTCLVMCTSNTYMCKAPCVYWDELQQSNNYQCVVPVSHKIHLRFIFHDMPASITQLYARFKWVFHQLSYLMYLWDVCGITAAKYN